MQRAIPKGEDISYETYMCTLQEEEEVLHSGGRDGTPSGKERSDRSNDRSIDSLDYSMIERLTAQCASRYL